MLGYSGGLDGLASSRNLKCIWYLAFNLPNSHLIVGKRMQLFVDYVESPHTLVENFLSRLVIYCDIFCSMYPYAWILVFNHLVILYVYSASKSNWQVYMSGSLS